VSEQPPIETIVQQAIQIGRAELAALAADLRAGGEALWDAPTHCAGWAVKDAVVHVLGVVNFFAASTRAALSGQPVAPPDEQAREAWAAQVLARPREEVLADLLRAYDDYAEYLETLDVAALDFPVQMPFGAHPVWWVAVVLLDEIVVHWWDIEAPRNPEARLAPAAVPPLVEMMVGAAGLLAVGPKTEGVWELDLGSDAKRSVAVRVQGDQVAVESGPAADANARLAMDGEAFVRLIWGRLDLERELDQGRIRLQGDRARALALTRMFPGA
jgi:uncharacterized protein (TIGR03083 family)